MEVHARQSGCSLLLHPFATSSADGAAQHRRISTLIEFLTSVSEAMVKVAIADGTLHESLIAVGDWFGARASSPWLRSDYQQTLFCRHAPTVTRWVRDFDKRIDAVLARSGVAAEESRDAALRRLEEGLDALSSPAGS